MVKIVYSLEGFGKWISCHRDWDGIDWRWWFSDLNIAFMYRVVGRSNGVLEPD